MAPSRPIARFTALTALVAVGLTLSTGVGNAEPDTTPTTVTEAQQQIIDLQHEIEIVTEEFNAATELREQKQAEAAKATADLGTVQADIEELTAQIGSIASAAYQGDNLTSFGSFMTSASPDEFLAKLSTLDAIGESNNQALVDLGEAQDKAAKLKTTADQALAVAAQSEKEIADKKAVIESKLPGLMAQLDALTAAEREVVDNAEFQATNPQPDPSEPLGPIMAPTEAAAAAVQAAYDQLGTPYVWGGKEPGGFDCSGLTSWSYAQAGVEIPRTSSAQSGFGASIPRDQVQAGDLVFFYSPVSHVGIAMDNESMIHAPTSGDVVKIASIDSNPSYSGATRPTA